MYTINYKMRNINIDMDGVVADFNKWASNYLGREVGWHTKDLTDDEWVALSKVDRLYFQMEVIPQSQDFVKFASEQEDCYTRFLTAIPRRTTIATAEQDKRTWAAIHFPGIPLEVGPFAKDKKKWCRAGEGDILIDDKESNIREWYEAGGIGIFHQGDWNTTFVYFNIALNQKHAMLMGL